MSTLSVRRANQASRLSRYIARARAKFSATQMDAGSVAALRVMFSDLARSAAFRVNRGARSVPHWRDVFAVPVFENRFMQPGVLFIGYVEAGLGLGESLRGLIRSVATTHLPFALYPFNSGVETRFISHFAADRYDLRRRYRVNVIEMSPDQLPMMFREVGRWKTAHSYNILRTYWELPQAPSEWGPMMKGIHEIWVPNEFVGNAFREIFSGPISIVPPCVEINTLREFGRKHFGMDWDRFYFMFSFDYFSYPARKNPLGVMRAFQRAFPDRTEDVGLVIKSTGATDRYPEIRSAILTAAENDPRIKVVDRMCSRDEMLSLIRESDCYVSLHRSEGFGLGMAEAMAFGKAIIATNYSGNTDFLTEHTGFPIPYTLRSVEDGEYIFSDGQSWAEPDEAGAAAAMQQVFCDRGEQRRRAEAGKAFVKGRYGRENVGRIASRRLEDILRTRL
jgi:glycosyltransferase involved in cell wall biosynthesis